MSAPEKCPKCGAVNLRFIDRNTSQFNCGSVSRNGTVVVQTALCVTKERDQLAERVKRLEEAGDKLIDAIQSVQCWNGTYVGDCVDEFESAKGNQ